MSKNISSKFEVKRDQGKRDFRKGVVGIGGLERKLIIGGTFPHSTYRGKISERSDDKLFMIDVKGDDRVKRQLAKDKPLYIEKILESRSAIPPVGTRLFSLPKPSPKEKGKESKANNAKIDKLVKRKLTHPEPTKPAKKSKGTAYDVWADEGNIPKKKKVVTTL